MPDQCWKVPGYCTDWLAQFAGNDVLCREKFDGLVNQHIFFNLRNEAEHDDA